jgi:hypothetical protein
MRRLDELFDRLARRGRHDDVDPVIDRLERRLAGEAQVVALRGRDEMGRFKWIGHYRALVAVGAALVVVLAIGGPLWILGGGGEAIDATETTATTGVTQTSAAIPASTTEPTPVTTMAPSSTISTTSTTTPAPPVLGSGWEIVAQNPGGQRFLGGRLDHIPGVGLVISDGMSSGIALSEDGIEWRLTEVGGMESAQVRGATGSGTGLVAYGERWCDQFGDSCTPALWVSDDGNDWVSIDQDGLFVGCSEIAGECHVSVHGAATDPDGRVVVLGIDPAVYCGDGCYELTPVAWFSADGHEWERHTLDIESLLPEQWHGMYNLQHPLVYVGGRWLAPVTLTSDPYETLFLESNNGTDWDVVDTGATFVGVSVQELAVGPSGIMTTDSWSAWVSPDGIEWVASGGLGGPVSTLAAFDDGFVGIRVSETTGEVASIWYSLDGTSWVEVAFESPAATFWNGVIGFGADLLAIGPEDNQTTIWKWSDE